MDTIKYDTFFTIGENHLHEKIIVGIIDFGELYIYGVKKFNKDGSIHNIYVDTTYMKAINRNWNKIRSLVKNDIIHTDRKNSDPIYKNTNMSKSEVTLIPWNYCLEFETDSNSYNAAKLMIDKLKVLSKNVFNHMLKNNNSNKRMEP